MKQKYFKLAQIVSKKSSSRPKMGCVLIKKNRILSIGFNNRNKTHPKSKTIGNFIHAELHAIVGVHPDDLKDSIAYVFREYANGDLAMAKPCSVCHKALIEAGVKHVFYTTYGGYSGTRIKA